MSRPIITLTTDFGVTGSYVAQMKGVILDICPEAQIVDITHAIAPQNIRQAALILEEATPVFPRGTIHIAVIDPGVGTGRGIVLAEIGGQRYIAPDNGLLSRLATGFPVERIVKLSNNRFWREPVSDTFHGRDIMAPVAAHLARGEAFAAFGDQQSDLETIAWPVPIVGQRNVFGAIVAIDAFGNLITNIARSDLPADFDRSEATVRVSDHQIRSIVRAYAQRPAGELVALFGSGGKLEVAVVNGNAARQIAAEVGDEVEITWE